MNTTKKKKKTFNAKNIGSKLTSKVISWDVGRKISEKNKLNDDNASESLAFYNNALYFED